MAESEKAEGKKRKVRRRDFLMGSSAAIAAGAVAVCAPESMAFAQAASAANVSYPASTGYLVYDSRLCLGCQSCMFACSMTHEGEANPSLSRIQIIRDAPSFTKYPYDVVMSVCRQCVSPLCVQNCPAGACHVDEANGNIRRIDQSKCIGCQTLHPILSAKTAPDCLEPGEEEINQMRSMRGCALLEPERRPEWEASLR